MTALLGASCSCLRPSSTDDLGVGYDELTVLIDEAEGARDFGVDAEWWLARHQHDVPIRDDTPWDLVVASLYARRSTASVQHFPYVSGSVTLLCIGADVGGVPLALNGVGALIVAPFDLVLAPIFLVSAGVADALVTDERLARAVEDIERARALGWHKEKHTWEMAWPSWGKHHVDVLGYDAAWLAAHR